jgi:hypothetical protein
MVRATITKTGGETTPTSHAGCDDARGEISAVVELAMKSVLHGISIMILDEDDNDSWVVVVDSTVRVSRESFRCCGNRTLRSKTIMALSDLRKDAAHGSMIVVVVVVVVELDAGGTLTEKASECCI